MLVLLAPSVSAQDKWFQPWSGSVTYCCNSEYDYGPVDVGTPDRPTYSDCLVELERIARNIVSFSITEMKCWPKQPEWAKPKD